MKHQPKREKLWTQWEEWKWNRVPGLSVSAPTVHVRVRERGMGRKAEVEVEVEEKKKKNLHLWNETAHWDADDKQHKQQQQLIKKMTQWMTSSCRGEYSQAECGKCRVMDEKEQFKVEGIHRMSGRKVICAKNTWCIPLISACSGKSG